MKTLPMLLGMCAALLVPAGASAMTDAECTAAWMQADADKNGMLSETEARRYYAALRVAQKPIADGKLSQAAFLGYCKDGLFAVVTPEAGAPVKGANSFTMAQAQDRALAAGFASVTGLKKDDNGVWRGTAKDGEKTVSIAIDYKGNVVAK
jgi:hypothetical protein